MLELKPILFRTSSGNQEVNKLSELERRIYELVKQGKGEDSVSLNPLYTSLEHPSHKQLEIVKLYLGIFEREVQNLDLIEENLNNEVYIGKLFGKTNNLFIIPTITNIRAILPDRLANSIYGSLFSEDGDRVIVYGDEFTSFHEGKVKEYLEQIDVRS
ncbi:MAG: hypothetical protein LAT82_04730 [Nanoarchaeota archaeon]|nr:hypothetical protein [Nanoarchaeota archaeon]